VTTLIFLLLTFVFGYVIRMCISVPLSKYKEQCELTFKAISQKHEYMDMLKKPCSDCQILKNRAEELSFKVVELENKLSSKKTTTRKRKPKEPKL